MFMLVGRGDHVRWNAQQRGKLFFGDARLITNIVLPEDRDDAHPGSFLSAAPINDPRYSDDKGLLDRSYRGLTHLDGLHRLIAWGRESRREIPAYVAPVDGAGPSSKHVVLTA